MKERTSDSSSSDFVNLGYYVVAFFDLLGQQDRLRSLRNLPNADDVGELERIQDALRNTYGAVQGMRKFFSDAFNAYARSRADIDVSGLSPEQCAEFSSWTNNEIKFRGFSDSLIAYMPLRTNDLARLPVRGVFGILSAAATTFTCCLAAGHPIRGGIDIGLGVEHGNDEIYGPALSRAYALESKIADYPRVVVGEEFIRYLALLRDQTGDIPLEKLAKTIAGRCLDCLAVDSDGQSFVDHMGPFYHQLVGDKMDRTVLETAYQRVLEFGARAKELKDSKLAFRYALLQDYFDDRLPLWREKK